MATNQQRREAERRRLQRQLEERRAREAARKRTTLIASVIGTVVVIAAIIVIVVIAASGSSGKKHNNAGGQNAGGQTGTSPTTTPTSPTAPTSTSPAPLPTKACAAPPKGNTATFQGVTVSGAKDLAHAPVIKSLSEHAPTTLQCMDLVVGKGKAATTSSTVSVQYSGVLYKNGTAFNSSWKDNGGKPASFPIAPGNVITGFSQGIGGAGKVGPMKVGGRRIMILPAALAYDGNPPQGSNIPLDAPLVFVVDLKSVTG